MDPLTWAYLALLIGGTAAQQQAVKKTDNERSKAMMEERLLRDQKDKDSQQAVQSTQDLLTQEKSKEAAKAAELAAQYKAPAATVGVTPPPGQASSLSIVPPGTSQRTIDATNTSLANAKGYTDSLAEMRAKLDAYGSVMGDASQQVGRNAQDIGRNARAVQQFQSWVLPATLAAAEQSGRQWSTAGDVMKLAAAVIGPSALGGGGAANSAGSTVGNTVPSVTSRSIEAAQNPWLNAGSKMMTTMRGIGSGYGAASDFGSAVAPAAGIAGGYAESAGQNAILQALRNKIARGIPLSAQEQQALMMQY